jgi:hypothetical protein
MHFRLTQPSKLTVFPFSDYRGSNIGPSDSERDCASRRDSDSHHGYGQVPRLGVSVSVHSVDCYTFSWYSICVNLQEKQEVRPPYVIAPSADSESGGSHSPSPKASRKRSKIRSHSLTSLCILSHHPFLSTFRECLFILKKLIDACDESSSPKRVGASRQVGR